MIFHIALSDHRSYSIYMTTTGQPEERTKTMHLFLISDTGNTILHPLDVRGTELGEWPGDADTDSDVEAAIADASDASGVEMVFAGFTGSDTVLVREGGEGAA